MPTSVVKTISQGGAGGADYASIALWQADNFGAASYDLVAVDSVVTGNILTAGGELTASSTGLLLIPPYVVTDATRTITLQAASGQGFSDNASVLTDHLRYDPANGVACVCSAANIAITIDVGNTIFRNLQIKSTTNSALEYDASTNPGTNLVDKCILTNTTATGVITVFTGAGATFNNCLIYSTGTGGDAGIGILGVYTSSTLVANFCDILTASDATVPSIAIASDGSAVTATIKNCAIYHTTAVTGNFSGGSITYTTCITDVASPPTGCTTVAYASAGFQNTTIASGDWRQTIDRTGTAVGGVTTDIAGQARGSPPSIGAWQVAAAGGGSGSFIHFGPFLGIWPQAIAAGYGVKLLRDLARNPVRNRRRMFSDD